MTGVSKTDGQIVEESVHRITVMVMEDREEEMIAKG